MHHRVNGCPNMLLFAYENTKMLNEFVKNETECRFIK